LIELKTIDFAADLKFFFGTGFASNGRAQAAVLKKN
jgi:hypothetical protein